MKAHKELTNQSNRAVMKAILQNEYGGPEVLKYQDTKIPKVKEGEVLVQVHAIGLNPPDWYLREGYRNLPPEWQPQVPFPIILGTDISGTITEVHESVKDFKIGDEVYAMVRFPSYGDSRAYAEYVSIPVADIAIKPILISHIEAAAAPMSLLTAWQFLIELGHQVQNPLQPLMHEPVPLKGKKVLINGAAGGVGHFAVQLARWQGAHVISVASGKHEKFLHVLGSDEFIDYTKMLPEDVVKDVDLVIDALGGVKSARFLSVIKPGGALFPIFPLGFSSRDEANQLGVTVSATQVRSSGSQLTELAALLNDGTIKVAIDSTFSLADAALAHRRAEQGHIQGKIVLTVR